MSNARDPFNAIDLAQLARVIGAAAGITGSRGGNNDQLMAMMSQISSAIQGMGKNKQSDPTMMMLMMMMLGGGGGGGGGGGAPMVAGVASPLAAAAQVGSNINIDVGVRGGGGGYGYPSSMGGGGGGGGCCGCCGW